MIEKKNILKETNLNNKNYGFNKNVFTLIFYLIFLIHKKHVFKKTCFNKKKKKISPKTWFNQNKS